MRKAVYLFAILISAYAAVSCLKPSDSELLNSVHSDRASKNRLQEKVASAKAFLHTSGKYNMQLAFFIDMKIPSGKNRFFIYDFQKDSICDQGLVAHGSGSETGIPGQLKFSNTSNSLCTSLGKYYIGSSYTGKFGKSNKLHGLDKTNDNAYSRNVVLHAYEDVPDQEQAQSICNSFGCPMVNHAFYKRIEKTIEHSEKNILLYIYY